MKTYDIGDHVLVTDPLIDLHKHPAIVHGYTPNLKYPYWVELEGTKKMIVTTEEQVSGNFV